MKKSPRPLLSRVLFLHVMPVLAALFVLPSCVMVPNGRLAIDNPYAQVRWGEDYRHKASLHVHTKVSDGRLFPHEAIDAYKALGYDVLAITDHNHVTHPWTKLNKTFGEGYEDRDPAALKMQDVQGNELSRHHHMNSYWTDHDGTRTETDSLDAIGKKGGQAMLCHPGRYKKDVAWYVDLYRRYDHLFGMEIFNQGDRYPGDRNKWDAVLTRMMPERPVWGLSNDDMHQRAHLGRNWNVLLMKGATEKQVRQALAGGRFYFVYCPKGHEGAPPPRIESIQVDQRHSTITVKASNCQFIEWISDGNIIGDGETLNLSEVEPLGSYVRAMLYGPEDGTIAGTQPFGIHKPVTGKVALAPGKPPEPFTIALLPDTQYYSQKFPETYVAQTRWISETAQERNTRFVIHLGDVVENAGSETEWQAAGRAHQLLDGHVPYSVLPGNHDGAPGNLALYNRYFGPSRFRGQPWYGGGVSAENNALNYCRFTAAGRQWMVLSVPYDPTEEELTRAGKIAGKHPDDTVIPIPWIWTG